MCEALAEFTVVPSPKLIEVEAIEPLGAVEPAVEAVTVTGAMPEVGVTASATVGGMSGLAVTVVVATEEAPRLSYTVAVTV